MLEHLICVDHVSLSPSVVEGQQLQGPQSLVVRQVMNGGYHAGHSALDPFHQLLICPVKRATPSFCTPGAVVLAP